MNTKLQFLAAFAILATMSLSLGCGSGNDLAQVTGVVTLDGAPVQNLSIEFIPNQGRPSLARTDEEGKFTAYYLPKQPGAAPGKHRLNSEFAQEGPENAGVERPKRRRGQRGARRIKGHARLVGRRRVGDQVA